MASESEASATRRGPLERLLGLFADVRAGEAGTLLLLALDVFLLLLAYYLIKVVREPLVLTAEGGGAEVKRYAAAGQVLLLVPVVKGIDAVSKRCGRIRLLMAVHLFFASNLVIFYALGIYGVPIGVAFFLWVGIFNVTIIAQFWSFANDVYTREQGRRLFAVVGAGASLGALVGSWVAKVVLDPAAVSAETPRVYQLMLGGAGILVVSFALIWFIHLREGGEHLRRPRGADDEPQREEPIGDRSAFQLLRSSRYLIGIGGVIVLLNWANTTGEYVLDRLLEVEAAERAEAAWEERLAQADGSPDMDRETFEERRKTSYIGSFRGDFFFWVNLATLVIQLFLVSRVLKYLGIRVALFVLPLVVLAGSGMLLVAPVLALARIVKIAENSLDYSLQNTAQQGLFLVTDRETKYKAKALIDTVFKRVGDVLPAVTVAIGAMLGLGVRAYVVVALILGGLWTLNVVMLAREHRRLTAE